MIADTEAGPAEPGRLPRALGRVSSGSDAAPRSTPGVQLRPQRNAAGLLACLEALARVAARARWVAVPGIAALIAAGIQTWGPPDLVYFGSLGRAIFSGHLSTAYAGPLDQSGPLQLLAASPFPASLIRPPWLLMSQIVMSAVLAAAAMWFVRAVRHGTSRVASAGHELAGGLVVSVWVVGGYGLQGHLAELVIPVCWVLAACDAQAGRPVRAGVLIGVAVGIEPWGILGIPVLLLSGQVPRTLRASATAIIVSTACYLPFVVTGHFSMFQHTWPINGGTLVHVLWPHAHHFGWGPRLIQASLSVGIGCGIAISLRYRTAATWLVPVSILLVRIILDPVQYEYYWVAPQIAFVAGVALLDGRRRARAVAMLGALWMCSADFGNWDTLETIAVLAVVIGLALAEFRAPAEERLARRPTSPAAGGQPMIDRHVGHVDADHRLAEPA